MKKILLVILLTGACTTTFAQTDNNITFGIFAGVNTTMLSYSNVSSSASISTSSLISNNGGVFADFRICEAFSIRPALQYIGKGGKEVGSVSGEGISINYDSKNNIKYLQVPVYGLYHAPAGSGDFYIGAGPFAAYGLSGTSKGSLTMTIDGETNPTAKIDNDVKFGNDEDSNYKRWDYGVSALVGYKFSFGLLINANYDLGLTNISPDAGEITPHAKTRVLGLSIGYQF